MIVSAMLRISRLFSIHLSRRAGILAVCTAAIPLHLGAADPPPRGYSIPTVDISDETHRQVVVDRERGQYLGHPSTLLLPDNKTILIAYPKGHGRGAIVYKKSFDGGLTWTERLPTPENWSTSMEVPTLFRLIDPAGVPRIVMFSGKAGGIRVAYSEDEGETWSPLAPIRTPGPSYGGIVTMGSMVELRDGSYMAFFHDDGRWLRNPAEYPEGKRFEVYSVVSTDGGLSWSQPTVIARHPTAHLCEPGVVRSPDGKQIALLLRENSRTLNSFVIFSEDEGKTWSEPRETAGRVDWGPSHGDLCTRRKALHQLSRPHPCQPHERRLGGLGRHLRGHRRRPRGPVPRAADGQPQGGRHRISRRDTPAGRHDRDHHLRALDAGRGALHRQRALQAGRARRPGQDRPSRTVVDRPCRCAPACWHPGRKRQVQRPLCRS